MVQQYLGFEMCRSWVQSIYRHMGVCRRLGTTGHPPVPRGIYEQCCFDYLHDINSKVKAFSIVPDLTKLQAPMSLLGGLQWQSEVVSQLLLKA